MNIRIIDEKEKNLNRKVVRQPVRRPRRSGGNYLIASLILIAILIVFIGASLQVSFSNEIEQLNRTSAVLKNKLHDMTRELDSVRIEEQKFTGKYILSKVKSLKLKLTFPKPGQVRKLYVDRNVVRKKSEFDGDFILSLN
jgi:hypothetical protein